MDDATLQKLMLLDGRVKPRQLQFHVPAQESLEEYLVRKKLVNPERIRAAEAAYEEAEDEERKALAAWEPGAPGSAELKAMLDRMHGGLAKRKTASRLSSLVEKLKGGERPPGKEAGLSTWRKAITVALPVVVVAGLVLGVINLLVVVLAVLCYGAYLLSSMRAETWSSALLLASVVALIGGVFLQTVGGGAERGGTVLQLQEAVMAGQLHCQGVELVGRALGGFLEEGTIVVITPATSRDGVQMRGLWRSCLPRGAEGTTLSVHCLFLEETGGPLDGLTMRRFRDAVDMGAAAIVCAVPVQEDFNWSSAWGDRQSVPVVMYVERSERPGRTVLRQWLADGLLQAAVLAPPGEEPRLFRQPEELPI